MLDINIIREARGGEPDLVRESQRRRGLDSSTVDRVIELDNSWIAARYTLDETNTRLKSMQKEIGALRKVGTDFSALVARREMVAIQAKQQTEHFKSLDTQVTTALLELGNIVHEDTPDEMKIEATNEKRASSGLSYQALLEKLTAVELQKGGVGLGLGANRGYYLSGPAALLDQSLAAYTVAYFSAKGYVPVMCPSMIGSQEGVRPPNSCEQSLLIKNQGDWFSRKALPIRYVGKAEIVSDRPIGRLNQRAGQKKNTGIDILHSHSASEISILTLVAPEDSSEEYNILTNHTHDFYLSLGLNMEMSSIPAPHLPYKATRQNMLSTWLPGSGHQVEMSEVTDYTDYLSRSVDIRCGTKTLFDKNKVYVHMVGGVVCRTQQLMACILENNYMETGINIPKVLQPFMGGLTSLQFTNPK